MHTTFKYYLSVCDEPVVWNIDVTLDNMDEIIQIFSDAYSNELIIERKDADGTWTLEAYNIS